MEERGEHTVTGSASGNDTGGWVFGALVILLFVVWTFVKYCSEPPHPPPEPPVAKEAVFTASDAHTPVLLTVSGGKYQIEYRSTGSLSEARRELAGEQLLTVNFSTGEITGNAAAATAILLIGDIDLRVGSVGKFDSLKSKISLNSAGDLKTATFEYRRDELTDVLSPQLRIFVIGKLQELEIGPGHGMSERRISLDLEPTPEEQADYRRRLADWEGRHGSGRDRGRQRERPRGR